MSFNLRHLVDPTHSSLTATTLAYCPANSLVMHVSSLWQQSLFLPSLRRLQLLPSAIRLLKPLLRYFHLTIAQHFDLFFKKLGSKNLDLDYIPCSHSGTPSTSPMSGGKAEYTLNFASTTLRAWFHVPVPVCFLNEWKTGDIIKKMGDVTHFMEGYFYVGCRFISISYLLTKFGVW
jgi:hypothetical protein